MEIFVTKGRTGEEAVRMDNPEIVCRTYPAGAARRGGRGDGRTGWVERCRSMGSFGSRPLLATRGLTKSFRSLVALRDHEIAVHTGEIVGVIGPNGSGKSTFFNLVSGFLRADRGEVLFGGASIM